ncbi:hypothetical protein Tco_1421732 [Tanacetum coccineum]
MKENALPKWSPDDLRYSVLTDGPYQTNPPYLDDIKNYIQEEQEGLVTRIRHRAEIPVGENKILTHEITRKDYGTKRGRHSTSSSSAFDQPSSSHLNDDNDDDDDENEEWTSRASTPSPTRFVNSLTNEVPRVFENPPNVDPDME